MATECKASKQTNIYDIISLFVIKKKQLSFVAFDVPFLQSVIA